MKAFYNGLRKVYGPQKRGTKQGVKQECVIAQHYFHCTLLLCSMLLLEMCMKEGIYIQPRSGPDLFNVSHFKSKTCTTKRLVRKMPFFLTTVRWWLMVPRRCYCWLTDLLELLPKLLANYRQCSKKIKVNCLCDCS